MKKLLFIAIIFVVSLACSKEESPSKRDCINNSSNASLADFTIGGWKILNEGNDGFSWDGRSLRSCGFVTNGTETGGVGNTYALKIPGVLARWRANKFAEFVLSLGWIGQTEKGVKIGDLFADVKAKYPTLELSDPYIDVYTIPTSGQIHVYMEFSLTTTELEYIDVTYEP